MKHTKVVLDQLTMHHVLYHKSYNSTTAKLIVTENGNKEEYIINRNLIDSNKLYHSKGVPCLLLKYGEKVIAYEKQIFGEEVYNIEMNFNTLTNTLATDDWYFDGDNFYQLSEATSDSFVEVIQLNTLNPQHIALTKTLSVIVNDALVVCKNGAQLFHTAPLFIDIENTFKRGGARTSFLSEDNGNRYVTLGALLKLCTIINKEYGSEEIEKFDLPQYMVRHKTVNLPNLPDYVKEKSNSYLKPYESLCFVLGKMYNELNNETIYRLKHLVKYLISYGTLDVTLINKDKVYKQQTVDIPLVKIVL